LLPCPSIISRSTEHSTTAGQKLESRDEPPASLYGCILAKLRDATGELEPIKIP
jgi:hypothetical protein